MNLSQSLPRASFWRETLYALRQALKTEWRWFFGFALVMGGVQFVLLQNFDLSELRNQLKNDPKETANNAEIVSKIWTHLGRSFIAQTVLSILASYIFTVLYLRRAATSAPPSFSMDGFLYWLGKSCQKYSILFFPIFVLEAIALLPIQTGMPQQKAALLILFLMSGWLCYYVFVMFRLSLVTPLAILKREPVLKTSWQTTDGKCLRIWWGFVVVTLILLPVFFVPYAADLVVADMWGNMSLPARALEAAAQGIWGALISVGGAVYYCTTYRILLQEQRDRSILGA